MVALILLVNTVYFGLGANIVILYDNPIAV